MATAGTGPGGTITLDVPLATFTTLLNRAQALGKSVSLTTKANDVTSQYTDLQAQITALDTSPSAVPGHHDQGHVDQ